MGVRLVVLALLHARRTLGALGVSQLIVAGVLVYGSAHAGTNTWTTSYPPCSGEYTTLGAAYECFDAAWTPQPQHLECEGRHYEIIEASGGNYSAKTYQQWDADPPIACDPASGETWVWWSFTQSCAALNKQWNADFGGCADICLAGQTLNTQSGTCVSLPTEVTERHSGATGGVCKGNPCDVISGNKVQRETDYDPGTGVLRFVRTYNSLRHHSAKQGSYGKPLGELWFGSYLQFIAADSGLSSGVVYTVRPNGDVIAFTATAPGSTLTAYEAEGELKERLVVALTSGTFVGWRYITAADDIELYDTNGRLLSIKNRGGVTQTLTYGSNSRVESVSDDFGHELSFQWDSSSPPRLTNVVLPGSGSGDIEFAYGADNNLVSVTYPDTSERHYLYELTSSAQRNLLTGIEDESDARYATWTYDSDNRAASSAHAGGVDSYGITYNTTNGTRTVVDPLGKSVTYTTELIAGQRRYTGASSQCLSCGGEYESATFDSYGNFESTTDFNGVETRYTHDTARTLEASRTEAYGTALERTTTTEWHSAFRLPIEINEPGRDTTLTYDANGNVLTQTVTDTVTSESRTWTMTHSTLGQLLTINGPRTDVTDVTTFTYYSCTTGDECGQLHTATDAANNITTYNSYNTHGLPLSVTDPNGAVITLEYDVRQRLTSRAVAGEETTFEYWPTGLLKKIIQPDASFVSYGYDAAHRLTSITDTAGNTITYTLNGAGQRLTEEVRNASNVLALRKTHVYDSLGRLIEEHGEGDQVASFDYDDEGNLIEIEDPVGRITEQAYDELNRLASITDPALQLTELEYDGLNNLLSVTDPRAIETAYVYNGFGEQIEQASPDTGTSASPRNAAGNVASATDARNETGDYTYDALNRLTEIEYGDDTVTLGYDAGSNGNGRLTSVANAASSMSFSYDSVGRVTERSQVTGSVTLNVSYDYDSYGRLQSLTTPSGQLLTYEYTNGRVSGLKVNGSYLLSLVTYQPFGPTTGWTWGNTTTTSREYDTDGQLTAVSSAGTSTYTYNDDGTIATRSDDFVPSLSWAAGTTTFTVASASNRLQSSTGQVSRSYGYDAAGNTTSDGGRTFTYTDSGRMTTATNASVTTTYSYNGLGERVKKTNSALTRHFAYDEAGHLVGEYDSAGNLVQETVWFGDIPVATLKANGGGGVNVFYIHTDHLNTPRRITRPNDNTIIWQWDSDPFGVSAANDDPDGDTTTFAYQLRFPGQYFDSETGLHYNYFRDYDAVTGRYIQSDPIGLDGGVNTYLYGDANPLRYRDPFGLQAQAIAPGVVVAGGAALACALFPENCRDTVLLLCEAVDEAVEGFLDPFLNKKAPRPGFWPGDRGAREWGRRHGVDADEAGRRFHKGIKPRSHTPGAQDDLWTNPDTGEVVDANGDYAGDLGSDYH
jgi:RHS repeat-associated protein